jgi:hypothetical protein
LAFGAIAAIALSGKGRSDPANERATCETRAKSAFQDLTREYASVLESVNVPFEIISNDYQAAYSDKLKSCLLLIRKRTSIKQEVSDTSYLIDAVSRSMYALYVEANGKMVSCMLISSTTETKSCKSQREFDDFVLSYVK